MHDQAKHLRRLVRQCAGVGAPAASNRPGMIVVSSGKGGVGTTTVAVNLAIALSRRGGRITLVDADPRGGNVALLCGLEEQHTLADVLAGRRTVGESLQSGPGGVRVLPGDWEPRQAADHLPSAQRPLLQQLENLGEDTDFVVLDAGNGPGRMRRRLWHAADVRLLVTTPEVAAILDSYASIKTLADGDRLHGVHTLVNLAASAETARNVHARIARACNRFLGLDAVAAGHIPADPHVAASGRSGTPLVLAEPRNAAARQFGSLAAVLAQTVATARSRNPKKRMLPSKARPRTRVTIS